MNRIGDDYFDSKEFRDLLSSYEQMTINGQPIFLDADELSEIADYYIHCGEIDKAYNTILQALSLSPGATMPLVLMAREALDKGDYNKADKYADAINDKEDPEYLFVKGEIMLAQDRLLHADMFFKEYSESLEEQDYDNGILDIADIYNVYGAYEEVLKWLEKAKDKTQEEYLTLLANTLFELKKYKESINIYTKLVDKNPWSTSYWNALSHIQLLIGDIEGALSSSEYAIAVNPNDTGALRCKADVLKKEGDFEEAQVYYQRCNNLNPDGFSLFGEGECLYKLGKNDEALAFCKQALDKTESKSPLIREIYLFMTKVFISLNDTKKAKECVDCCQSLGIKGISYEIILGSVLIEKGEEKKAIKELKRAVESSKKDPKTLLCVTEILVKYELYEQANKLIERYIKLNKPKDDGLTCACIALCFYLTRQEKGFVKYLKSALELDPKGTESILKEIFPERMKAKDYYQYIINKCKK